MAVKKAIIDSLEVAAGDQRGTAIVRFRSPGGSISVTCLRSKGATKKTTCTWSLYSCIKEFQIRWWYQTLVIGADGSYKKRWVVGQDWKTLPRWATSDTFSIPDGATDVWVDVWMGPEDYVYYASSKATSASKGKCFSPATVSAQVFTGAFDVPEIPEITSAKVGSDGETIEVSVKDSDPYTMAFRVEGNAGEIGASSSVRTDSHSYEASAKVLLKGAPGKSYSIRARMQNILGNWSGWYSWAEPVRTRPARTGSPRAQATSAGAAALSWDAAAGAEWYEIAYANSPRAFSLSSGFKTKSTKELAQPSARTFSFDDLDSGKSWFFWVRGCNAAGDGDWSPASAEIVLGKAPAAPTVWADSYVSVRGESVTVRWVHNASDGTAQSRARVSVRTSPSEEWTRYEVSGSASSMEVPTAGVADGGYLDFYVNTWGASTGASVMSPDSDVRRVRVWQRPAVEVRCPAVAEGFPLAISVESVTQGQSPVALALSIAAEAPHEAVMADGSEEMVDAGAQVWGETYYGTAMPLSVELTPRDLTLTDGQRYLVTASCAMSSGLSCRASSSFAAKVPDGALDIQIDITARGDWGCEVAACAYVPPDIAAPSTSLARPTETDPVVAEGIVLDIYRHETDGTMTPLMTGVPNGAGYTLTDGHAALGEQSYRVTATDVSTGAIEYEDATASVVSGRLLLVQWDGGVAQTAEVDGSPAYAGDSDSGAASTLALPWDIEGDEDNDRDVSLVEYIGRPHPVAYSGTQLGQTSTWRCDIEKTDRATLALIRALAAWRGEAYVRDTLGSGYWASVKPSISTSYDSPKIAVTLDVARVDRKDPCIDLGGAL